MRSDTVVLPASMWATMPMLRRRSRDMEGTRTCPPRVARVGSRTNYGEPRTRIESRAALGARGLRLGGEELHQRAPVAPVVRLAEGPGPGARRRGRPGRDRRAPASATHSAPLPGSARELGVATQGIRDLRERGIRFLPASQ